MYCWFFTYDWFELVGVGGLLRGLLFCLFCFRLSLVVCC